jgi:hypothetical protein
MESSLAGFTPAEEDIKSDGVRRIFTDVPLDYDEEEILDSFRTYAREKRAEIPPWYPLRRADDNHHFLLRVLESVDRNPRRALKSLLKHANWKATELPVRTEEVQSLLVTDK